MCSAVCLPNSVKRRRYAGAFTLFEVIIVLTVVMILAVLIVPQYGTFVARAQETACMANMRSIHLGLSSYLNDHGDVWPQGPLPDDGAALVYSDFWINTLAPYGIGEKVWLCPTAVSLMKNSPQMPRIHYSPTLFDATPGIARRWATQPWLVEMGNMHGKGAHICFPDGTVKPLRKVLAEQGLLP